jgi:2Fe-2S ferredoxin
LCPDGTLLEGKKGTSVLNLALQNGIGIEHACEKVCACTTFHIVVSEGFDSLKEGGELGEDMLNKAWNLEPESRLGCQAIIQDEDLVVDIPKYTVNMVSEGH